MNTKTRLPLNTVIREQAAKALLKATDDFLKKSGVGAKRTHGIQLPRRSGAISKENFTIYKRAMRAYESMGTLMATWFSEPKFLDKFGNPLPLSPSTGSRSITNLIRQSRVRISRDLALEFLRLSPSIDSNANGSFVPLRRVFVLPEFEIPRAAIVVERYLQTLLRNSIGRKRGTALLLERSCYVREMDLSAMNPILRDIKERGTAFMDSTDGEIEAARARRSGKRSSGEIGVVVFAWTKAKTRSAPSSRRS